MPIYIGDKEIATVFKGDTELDNIQLGDQQQWIGIIVTPDPTITYISRNTSSLTFDLTNNHEETVTIFYEIDDNTPDQNSVVVAANATQRVTLSGLSSNTTYSLFAYALEAEQIPSNTISNTQTTQDITENPSILSVNPDKNSVTFSLRNNDNVTATIRYEVNDSTPDISVSVGAGQTVSRTISGLNSAQGYTLYARAIASGKATSSTVSTGFTTDSPWYVNNISYVRNQRVFGSYVYDISFEENGSVMWLMRRYERLTRFNLSTPYDISTASEIYEKGFPKGFHFQFGPGGTKLYVTELNDDSISEYDLPSPYDVQAINPYDSAVRTIYSLPATGDAYGFKFNDNGTKLFVAFRNTFDIKEFSMSSPYNLGSLSNTGRSLNLRNVIPSNEDRPNNLHFNEDGKQIIISDASTGWIHSVDLSTAYTLSGFSNARNLFDFDATIGQPSSGIAIKPDGTKFFGTSYFLDRVYEFNIT